MMYFEVLMIFILSLSITFVFMFLLQKMGYKMYAYRQSKVIRMIDNQDVYIPSYMRIGKNRKINPIIILLEQRLDKANWKLSVANFFAISILCSFGGLYIGFLLKNPALLFTLAIYFLTIPYQMLSKSQKKQKERLNDDVKDILVTCYKYASNYSNSIQIIELSYESFPSSFKPFVKDFFTDIKTNIPIYEAFDRLANRIDNFYLKELVYRLKESLYDGTSFSKSCMQLMNDYTNYYEKKEEIYTESMHPMRFLKMFIFIEIGFIAYSYFFDSFRHYIFFEWETGVNILAYVVISTLICYFLPKFIFNDLL